MAKSKVNSDRMRQLVGQYLILTVDGDGCAVEMAGTLNEVDGRIARFDGFDVWIPNIRAVKEQLPLV